MEDKHEHGKIHEKIDTWVNRMSLGFENLTQTLSRMEQKSDETLSQTKKTNGRVTKLELDLSDFVEKDYKTFKDSVNKDLEFFSLIRRKKWVIAVFVLAFAKVYETIDVEKIIKWVTTLFI